MDRSVVRRRLQAAKIKPVDKKEKKTIYELTPEVEELLAESGNPKLDEVELRIKEADARWKEARADEKTKRLVDPELVLERLIPVIKSLRDHLVFTYSAQAGPALHKLKTGRQVSAALKRDLTLIFSEFREDFSCFMDPAKKKARSA